MSIKNISILLFTVFLSLLLCSYENGAAHHSGIDGTGAEGSAGCSNGGGCHTVTTTNNAKVELDSAGVAVKTYQPGGSYMVKLSGINSSSSATLAYFGFQLATVLRDSTAQAGTWGTALPSNIQQSAAFRSNLPIIEQSTHLPATSGSGGNGTTYDISIPWTAPAAGTGPLCIYGVLNAVSGLDVAFLGFYQLAVPDTINEAIATGLRDINSAVPALHVWPSVVNSNFNVSFNIEHNAEASITLFTTDGKMAAALLPLEMPGGVSFSTGFNISNLQQGIYLLRVVHGNTSSCVRIVKE